MTTNDRIHAQQRRVHLGHGKRSSIAFHGGHGDHARPIAGLGRGPQSLRRHLARGADAAPACRSVSAARAAEVGGRPGLRPRLPHAQSDRGRARHHRHGAGDGAGRGDGGLRSGPPAVGGHADRRTRKRRRGNGAQVPPRADRRRRRHPDRDDPLRLVRGSREARTSGGSGRSDLRHRGCSGYRDTARYDAGLVGERADGHTEDGSEADFQRHSAADGLPFRRPRRWPPRSTGPCAR